MNGEGCGEATGMRSTHCTEDRRQRSTLRVKDSDDEGVLDVWILQDEMEMELHEWVRTELRGGIEMDLRGVMEMELELRAIAVDEMWPHRYHVSKLSIILS